MENQASSVASTSCAEPEVSLPSQQPHTRRERIVVASKNRNLAELRKLAAEPGGFESSELRKLAWPVLLGLEEEEEEEEADVSTPVPALTASEPSTTFNRDSVGESSELRKETEPELLPEKIEQHRDEGQVRLDVNRSFVSFPQGITPAEKEELRVVLERVIIAVLRRNRSLRYFQGYHDIVSVFQLTLVDEELVFRATEKMSLHRMRDSMGAGLEPVLGYLKLVHRILARVDPELSKTINLAADLPYFALSWVLTNLSHDLASIKDLSRLFDFLLSHNPVMISYLGVAIILLKKEELDNLDEASAEDPAILHHTLSRLPPIVDTFVDEDPVKSLVDSATDARNSFPEYTSSARSPSPSASTMTDSLLAESLISLSELGSSISSPSSTGLDDSMLCDPDVFSLAHFPPPSTAPPASPSATSSTSSSPTKQATISIDDLIHTSLYLYETYPLLGENGIGADLVMGSQSCIFTWPLSMEGILSDRDAHEIAEKGVDIVLPLVDLPLPVEEEEGSGQSGEDKGRRRRMRRSEVQFGVGIAVLGIVGVVLAIYGEEIKEAVKAGWGMSWNYWV